MSMFEVMERLLSTLRLTSNGDRRTGRGFMKVEKKDLKNCTLRITISRQNIKSYLGVVMCL